MQVWIMSAGTRLKYFITYEALIHNIYYFRNAHRLTLVLLNPDMACFANSVDPDHLANWSGYALFAIKYVNLNQESGCGRAIIIYSPWQGLMVSLIFLDLRIRMYRCFWGHFAWNVKSCFLGKNKKNISKCRLLKFLPRLITDYKR